MADFRYTAIGRQNKTARGVITAPNAKDAKKTVDELCRKNNLRLQKFEKRSTYTYLVQKRNEKPVRGEQKAFSKEEIISALQKMEFKVLKIQKKLLDFRPVPPSKDIVMFIRITADLLREKLNYNEILGLLITDMENKTLKETIREIVQDLKDGKEGKEVFGRHSAILGKFPSYMLGVASTSGDMVSVYESTAKFMERNEEFKKSLKQALVMPVVILFVLMLAILFYVAYIFPKTAEMFLKFEIPLPPMTRMTLDLSNFLQDNFVVLILIVVTVVGIILKFVRSQKGKLIVDKAIPKIPVVGTLIHKTSIEIFARVFYSLYSGSGENINVLRIASEACRNTYMEKQIKEVAIPMMIKEGKGLVESLEATDVFPKNALSRLRSGAETGTLKTAALQLANYYEKETSYKLKNIIDLINISVAMFIMIIMIGLTLVSSETALVKPPNPMMK
ncbi:MAG: type II secretion system F family protein [bacterium]|nr:type II secretion system F family protein [bacterium]